MPAQERETYTAARALAVGAAAFLAAGPCPITAAAFLAAGPGAAAAQVAGPRSIDAGGLLEVGGEAERYLRVLQLAGLAPATPWGVRPVPAAAGELALPTRHPWRSRWSDTALGPRGRRGGAGREWAWLRPGARLALNTTFPFEVIPGPTWAGRGLTVELDGGLGASWGRLRLQVQPKAFVTQNAGFTLAPNGLAGDGAARDARFPQNVDAPQRFGDGAYGRVDPGNTSLVLDLGHALAGFSTAAESWGTAREYPLILGPASGGFAHAFVGTSRPVNLRVVRLAARLIAGTLPSSGFFDEPDPAGRWASGLVFSILPAGLDGLEFGMARIASGLSPSGIPGPGNVFRVFRTKINVADDNLPDENQVASAFFRWAPPRARLEVYGEYLREDFAVELRRFAQYPDDYATYVLGLQHVRPPGEGRLRAIRVEFVNGEVSSSNRRERGVSTAAGWRLDAPIPPYTHSRVTQGHTNRGLFLGSPEAYGGAGWRVGLDEFDPGGRRSVTVERRLRFDWLPGAPSPATNPAAPAPRPDVIYAVRFERLRFGTPRDVGLTVIPMLNLNRNLRPGSDRFNLSVAASLRGFR